VVGPAQGLGRGPQGLVGRDHFRHRHGCAHFLAQHAKRTIRHTGHGGNDQPVFQGVGTNAHQVFCGQTSKRAAIVMLFLGGKNFCLFFEQGR
jgi:hypothetical protein